MGKVELEKISWQAGYDAGRRRYTSIPPEGVDALSWLSGYIEGKAAPTLNLAPGDNTDDRN